MKRVLVTGAAGFIGSSLSEKLIAHGYQVTGLDNFDPFYPEKIKQANLKELRKNTDFRFVEADIRNAKQLEQVSDVDIVIHIAAKAGVRPSIDNPSEYIETNIHGSQNILEWMRKRNCGKLIFSSSSSVYGNNSKIPFSENDVVDFPISPYAATKKSAELFNYTYHHLYNYSVLNFRLFTVYGPRQRPDLAIHKFFKKLLNNEAIDIYGDGKTGRDYTYVDDITNGILSGVQLLLTEEKSRFEIINLGNNKPVLLADLVAMIEKVSEKKFRINYLPMQPGDVEQTFADITKAKKLLKYQPATSLEEGLTRFYEWFISQG